MRPGKSRRRRLPDPGTCFAGRYELREKIAAGGMGAVYRAEDTALGRSVAIKLLHPELSADPEMQRRFSREASILAALDHPAVVRVHDVGEDEGLCFTVMELLEGETLHARIERPPPMAVDELRPLLRDMAAGLHAAHEHGVLHGDLKPANIFLLAEARSGPTVKLVDFGTSKVHGLDRLTRTGEVIGTPTYMPPELLTGEGEIDERIDTYALGVLLYEAFAGQPPFRERNPGRLMFKIVTGDSVPLSDVRPDLPKAIVEVVAKAMAPKREDRFRWAPEIAVAFEAAADS